MSIKLIIVFEENKDMLSKKKVYRNVETNFFYGEKWIVKKNST